MGILLKGGRSFYNPPIGHLHDDAILLLRPETFRVLLSFANYSFCYLNFAGITKLIQMKRIEWRHCVNEL